MNSKTSTSRNWDAHVYMVFLPPRDGTQQLRGTNLFMPHLSHGHLHSSYVSVGLSIEGEKCNLSNLLLSDNYFTF